MLKDECAVMYEWCDNKKVDNLTFTPILNLTRSLTLPLTFSFILTQTQNATQILTLITILQKGKWGS